MLSSNASPDPRRGCLALVLSVAACQSGGAAGPAVAPLAPRPDAPAWVLGDVSAGGKVCAIGIAGRTHAMATAKAEELSRERAIHNLAGVFETLVEESEIDESTQGGTQIEYARSIQVTEDTLARIDHAAAVEYWRDEAGAGPFEERGFTYARACVDAGALNDAKLDVSKLSRAASETKLTADVPPVWLTWVGSQKGARLCAVGFSLPALHPDATFENVVEDIRGQLTEKSKTLVMSLSEEFSACRGGSSAQCDTVLKIVTAATTEAISKGVLVNHFWYDRKGVGPNKKRRSTYGWGCTHPVGTLEAVVEKVKTELPDVEVPPEESVQKRAARFFDELAQREQK